MSDDDIEDKSREEEIAPIVPWITGIEAFMKFGKSAPELKMLKISKKVRTKKINGKEMFSVTDLECLPEGEDGEERTSMADLVRAARDMLAVGQKHEEVMFDKYMASFDKLLKVSADNIDKQNEHILELEKQALAMREATDKVFNLEHTRKMDELREERTRAMQSKALEMLQKTIGPWVAEKLGGKVPGVQATPETPDPRLAQLGQAVIGMISTMTDEQFQQLSKLIGADEFTGLSMIRDSMKGSS